MCRRRVCITPARCRSRRRLHGRACTGGKRRGSYDQGAGRGAHPADCGQRLRRFGVSPRSINPRRRAAAHRSRHARAEAPFGSTRRSGGLAKICLAVTQLLKKRGFARDLCRDDNRADAIGTHRKRKSRIPPSWRFRSRAVEPPIPDFAVLIRATAYSPAASRPGLNRSSPAMTNGETAGLAPDYAPLHPGYKAELGRRSR